MISKVYFAHSAQGDHAAQSYQEHVENVHTKAVHYAEAVAAFATNKDDGLMLVNAVSNAAAYHDLGKLEEENQEVLKCGNLPHLPINHTDAGTAYLLGAGKMYSSIGVMSHHIGLPDIPKELSRGSNAFRDADISIATDQHLPMVIGLHKQLLTTQDMDEHAVAGCQSVFWRLLLSCLADADHGDTAIFYGNESDDYNPPDLRPSDRLQALNTYIDKLGGNDERSFLRSQMYQNCRDSKVNAHIVACDSPVGSGKTTAVMAHLLQQAATRHLRRIFVVLPFTNIITQSVEKYRECLVLPGEDPQKVVAEVHHRVDFETEDLRHLSTLWHAPIIVTTAVAFFETLASNRPSVLRRLHELPGSAIFVDEAHAALPSHLLPIAWKWMSCFADDWNCHWVLASGSLNRFWTIPQIADAGARVVPDLVSASLRSSLALYEQNRITHVWHPEPFTSSQLAEWVFSFPGPRLVIVNTVQSAAVIADTIRKMYGRERVEHLSTSLTAHDRAATLARIRQRLDAGKADDDWILVATSCVEAGVDFSFTVGFRELASLSSLLQASGRVNRSGKTENAQMWSFCLDYADEPRLKEHPILQHAAAVLRKEFFEKGRSISPDAVTESIQLELSRYGEHHTSLLKDDANLSFAQVEEAFQVIENRSVPALVNSTHDNDFSYCNITREQIQMNTIQIPKYRIEEWYAQPLRNDLYLWTLAYDNFLGYMAGVLNKDEMFFV